MLNAIKNNPRRALFWAIPLAVFCWMLLLNCLTPYLADDFTFSFSFADGEKLTGLGGLLASLRFHYFDWTGRVVVKFFAQGFTMLPKMIFNICNATVYTLLGLVLYRLAAGQPEKPDLAVLAGIYISLWLVSPVFGQTNLWMCGACNYLWATFGCALWLLPWRRQMLSPFSVPVWQLPLFFLAGFLAGALSENTSAGLLVALVLIALQQLVTRRKLPLWMVCGLVGSLLGYVFLIAAPGNYNRHDVFPDGYSMVTRLATRFFTATNMLWDCGGVLLLIFAALFTLCCFTVSKKQLLWPSVLALAALGANYAMVLSPVYYYRSSHGVFSLLTAACAACFALLDKRDIRRWLCAALAAAGVLCLLRMAEGGYDIASYAVMYSQREVLIDQQTADGVVNGETYGIACYTPYCGAYGLPDIREDSGDAIGLARAKWHNMWMLSADEVRTYPFPGHENEAYQYTDD